MAANFESKQPPTIRLGRSIKVGTNQIGLASFDVSDKWRLIWHSNLPDGSPPPFLAASTDDDTKAMLLAELLEVQACVVRRAEDG